MKTKIVIFLALFLCFLATLPVRPALAQPNQPPVATDDAYPTDEDTPLNEPAPGVLGNDTDAEWRSIDCLLVDRSYQRHTCLESLMESFFLHP